MNVPSSTFLTGSSNTSKQEVNPPLSQSDQKTQEIALSVIDDQGTDKRNPLLGDQKEKEWVQHSLPLALQASI